MPQSNFVKLKITTAAVADQKFIKPVVSNRNRLEGLPRSAEFEKSLRAEIADPLWLLSRQWQLGEFQGEDAATACQAKILAEEQQPEIIRLKSGVNFKYETQENPLEMQVEQEKLEPNLYLRLQMGRHFVKILKQNNLKSYAGLLLKTFPITEIINNADKEAVFLGQAVMGSFPDGLVILEKINSGEYATFIQNEPSVDANDVGPLTEVVIRNFTAWFAQLYNQPIEGQSAWVPENMEYNFELDLPHPEEGKKVSLIADQYASGKLDWVSFDENVRDVNADDGIVEDNLKEVVQTFLPSPLVFGGMPNPRYWQMEENRTDFGKLETGTTGLLSLLVAEYGLTYSNDWFILPYQMKMNTLCEVKGIIVTDVFGQNILIQPTFTDPEMNWHQFAAFRHTERQNKTSARNRFYLPPTLLKLQPGDPIEKINFMRDEMSNMVWAIESTIPSAAGGGRDVKINRPRFDQDFVPFDPETKVRYLLGTSVPENWIPFVPVHKSADQQEIRLQRARIPNAVPPFSRILNEQQPVHFIEEEEVPRSGVILKRQFKRTRWLNGKTKLWVGRTKTTGRGEGWSGLMFDQILDI